MLQLQLFSLQILHSENIFSAKGFTVDATLFVAVSVINNLFYLVCLLFRFHVSFLDSG